MLIVRKKKNIPTEIRHAILQQFGEGHWTTLGVTLSKPSTKTTTPFPRNTSQLQDYYTESTAVFIDTLPPIIVKVEEEHAKALIDEAKFPAKTQFSETTYIEQIGDTCPYHTAINAANHITRANLNIWTTPKDMTDKVYRETLFTPIALGINRHMLSVKENDPKILHETAAEIERRLRILSSSKEPLQPEHIPHFKAYIEDRLQELKLLAQTSTVAVSVYEKINNNYSRYNERERLNYIDRDCKKAGLSLEIESPLTVRNGQALAIINLAKDEAITKPIQKKLDETAVSLVHRIYAADPLNAETIVAAAQGRYIGSRDCVQAALEKLPKDVLEIKTLEKSALVLADIVDGIITPDTQELFWRKIKPTGETSLEDRQLYSKAARKLFKAIYTINKNALHFIEVKENFSPLPDALQKELIEKIKTYYKASPVDSSGASLMSSLIGQVVTKRTRSGSDCLSELPPQVISKARALAEELAMLCDPSSHKFWEQVRLPVETDYLSKRSLKIFRAPFHAKVKEAIGKFRELSESADKKISSSPPVAEPRVVKEFKSQAAAAAPAAPAPILVEACVAPAESQIFEEPEVKTATAEPIEADPQAEFQRATIKNTLTEIKNNVFLDKNSLDSLSLLPWKMELFVVFKDISLKTLSLEQAKGILKVVSIILNNALAYEESRCNKALQNLLNYLMKEIENAIEKAKLPTVFEDPIPSATNIIEKYLQLTTSSGSDKLNDLFMHYRNYWLGEGLPIIAEEERILRIIFLDAAEIIKRNEAHSDLTPQIIEESLGERIKEICLKRDQRLVIKNEQRKADQAAEYVRTQMEVVEETTLKKQLKIILDNVYGKSKKSSENSIRKAGRDVIIEVNEVLKQTPDNRKWLKLIEDIVNKYSSSLGDLKPSAPTDAPPQAEVSPLLTEIAKKVAKLNNLIIPLADIRQITRDFDMFNEAIRREPENITYQNNFDEYLNLLEYICEVTPKGKLDKKIKEELNPEGLLSGYKAGLPAMSLTSRGTAAAPPATAPSAVTSSMHGALFASSVSKGNKKPVSTSTHPVSDPNTKEKCVIS